MQAPRNSGSRFFNYKGTHSLVLLAVCNAKYVFKMVDIGTAGRQSDGGSFRNSSFGQALELNILNVPPAKELPNSVVKAPYVLVGDEAFPLTKFLMRPYPGSGLQNYKTIFNYRLSRARRVIENTFGIMTARLRIFRRPIQGNVENVEQIIKAGVCIHNWIMQNEAPGGRNYCPLGYDDHDRNGVFQLGQWRNEVSGGEGLVEMGRMCSNTYSRDASTIREGFAGYFMETGQIPWQWTRI